MPNEDIDTERSVVKTYVPAYQKQRWQRQADELEMSQSEFVRTMVQAGRRGFEGPAGDDERNDGSTERESEPTDSTLDSGSRESTKPMARFDDHLIDHLSADDHRAWDELRDALASELVDERLDDALQRLQRENRVQYSGRHGGYTLVDER